MILILDCNIWISLTINRNLDFVVQLTETGFQIASCAMLKQEIIDVLSRPKLKKFIPPESVENVAKLHDLITKTYKLTSIPNVVSDNKDNYLFALCTKSKADYLVSGDKIILQVVSYSKTKMIALGELERLVK